MQNLTFLLVVATLVIRSETHSWAIKKNPRMGEEYPRLVELKAYQVWDLGQVIFSPWEVENKD